MHIQGIEIDEVTYATVVFLFDRFYLIPQLHMIEIGISGIMC